MASNAYRERLKSVAKDYAKLPHLKRQLNEKLVSSKINSIIYNDKKDFLIIEDSSSNNHVQLLKASNNGAVESWDGSGALEAVPGVTRSNYLNSTEVARFVSESDVKRAFGRKFKDIYKDTNLKVYGIRPGGMYSVGEDNTGRKVWCDVLIHYRHKIRCYGKGDLYVYSTDVYFNAYPEYILSCGSYNVSFHLLDRRIIKCLSSNLIRNNGLTTTEINNAPQYFLTDVEDRQQHCIIWGGWYRGPNEWYYTSDRNFRLTNYIIENFHVVYSYNAFYSERAYSKTVSIHGVDFTMLKNKNVRIHTNPHIDVVF